MIKIYFDLESILKDKDLYPFYENKDLIREIVKKINLKFEFHLKHTKTFIAELYKEREWTKLYSIHYGQIFNDKIINKTIRIHLFNKEINSLNDIQDNDESYLGYFTLRPLPTVSGIISRARLKIFKNQYRLTDEEKYINFIYTTTNLYGKSFKYPSFPFIAQDNVVSVCAHADILMLSKYMYKKFNFNLIEIDTILTNIESHNGRKIPSDGLVLEQILKVLEKNRYNPSLFRAKGDKVVRFELTNSIISKIDSLDLFEVIDVAIRSDLSLILAISSYVILINSYFYKDGKKYYIIYDDSSYYIKKMTGKYSYSEAIEEEKIRKFLNSIYEKEKEETYLIIPTFDRFYFRYPSLYILIHLVIKKYIEKNYEDVDIKRLKYKTKLADSIKLKKEIEDIRAIDMPHYVWYIEWFDNLDKIGYSIVDATAHKNDIYYSTIIKFKEIL